MFTRLLRRPRQTFLVGSVLMVALLQMPVPAPSVQANGCAGDCGDEGVVTVDELLRLVNIALNLLPIGECTAGDTDGNAEITVDEVLAAVNAALLGCPAVATPTPTSTPRPMGLDLTGHWAGRERINGVEVFITFDFIQDGDRISGTFAVPSEFEDGTVSGTLVGNRLTGLALSSSDPDCPATYRGTGTASADEISFSFTGSDCDTLYSGSGSATRVRFCQGNEPGCCGNGVVDGREECDISGPVQSCQDLGFEGGQTFCNDCLLDRGSCFTGGTCRVGGECDENCFEVCGGSFAQVCSNGQCVRGSCICLEDFSSIEECCERAGQF